MVNYHPAKFSGNRRCGSGDIMILVGHVILHNHVTKGLCNVTGRSPSKSGIILPSLVVIGTVVVWRYNDFSLSRDHTGPRDQRSM